jgi:signal transduction histidine kinase
MQQADSAGTGNRRRLEARGETLAALRGGENFSELAHDARNMVTALALYCELLEEPGVLNPAALHLAQELRLVTAASWRLLEKLARVERRGPVNHAGRSAWRSSPLVEALPGTRPAGTRQVTAAERPCYPGIEDLAVEVESNRNLLAALTGPGVTVRVRTNGGACPVRLNGEDLTRILVNLVRNATESMHGSGSIRIGLSECVEGSASRLLLTVVDSGPGIPDADLERVFEKGFSTSSPPNRNGRQNPAPSGRRGLGLSIARHLVEAAGGRIVAGNCATGGARIAIELPMRTE